MSAAAFPGEWYYVVRFEAIDQTAEAVIAVEALLELIIGEIGGEVGKSAVLRPNLVASVEELVGEEASVHAEERLILYADVVEADILGAALEAAAILLVVGEAVEVVVDGVVVDHLRDRDVMEEARIIGAPQVLGKHLHEKRLAHTDTALDEEVLVELVAPTGKHLLGEWAVVEIVEQEAEHLLVVGIDDEAATLRRQHHIVGNEDDELAVGIVGVLVGEIETGRTLLVEVFTEASGALVHGEPWNLLLSLILAEDGEDASVPLLVASGLASILRQLSGEASGIIVIHNTTHGDLIELDILPTEAAVELVGRRRQLVVGFLVGLSLWVLLAHPRAEMPFGIAEILVGLAVVLASAMGEESIHASREFVGREVELHTDWLVP